MEVHAVPSKYSLSERIFIQVLKAILMFKIKLVGPIDSEPPPKKE